MLLFCRLQECMSDRLEYAWPSTGSTLVKEYKYEEAMLMRMMLKYVDGGQRIVGR